MNFQLKELVQNITEANEAYYGDGESIFSDSQYDAMKAELAKKVLEPYTENEAELMRRAKLLLQSVGAPEKNNSVAHMYQMYSLDNRYGEVEAEDWAKSLGPVTQYVISDKKDGSAVELQYSNGHLIMGSTRGDGVSGDDITHSVKLIPGIPHTIPILEDVQITGEVALPLAHFEKVKEIDDLPYKNARNAANGIVRRKNPTESTKYLKFFAYGLSSDAIQNTNYDEDLELLKQMGFDTVSYSVITTDKVLKAVQSLENDRDKNETLIDGAVLRVRNNRIFEKLGFTSKFPRGAVAIKFESFKAEAILKEVLWTKGRKGKISPNAIYDPIDLNGITNDRCLMHTPALMNKLGVKIGARIIVEKCGDIIPQIFKVRTDLFDGTEQDIQIPTHCPVCNQPIVYRGDYLYCENEHCGDKAYNSLLTWVNAIGFRGIGPAAAEKLTEHGNYKEIPDFFKLTEQHFIDAGVAPKNAKKLVIAIQDIKNNIQPQQVLHGLSIDYCGEGTAKDIVLDAGIQVWDMVGKSEDWFMQIPNIGPVTAASLAKWFGNPQNGAIIANLKAMGVLKEATKPEAVDGPLKGKLICITGTLSRDKKEYYHLIETKGGQWTDSFKKSISYMVVGEKAGSKETKAREAGIEIWTEQDLMNALK